MGSSRLSILHDDPHIVIPPGLLYLPFFSSVHKYCTLFIKKKSSERKEIYIFESSFLYQNFDLVCSKDEWHQNTHHYGDIS